ncbi:thioredoxin-like fold [Anaeramoeba flamelloides]|uniref:Thioredoxin-like fold n=1 Tax=Anaeramoeba flamelloides TaxID=1746091 RepID=A0ABQ8XV39_9EUKA|nr:thioredoxin-like fold [Anaeramoeba flamelloides]
MSKNCQEQCCENIFFSKAFVGKKAPTFTAQAVVDSDFKEVTLESLHDGKWLVLFFYPLDFTFTCPTEIRAFSQRIEEFKKLGCNVAAVSTDSKFSHFAWVNTDPKKGGLGPMDIPLISDNTMKISQDYGVLIKEEGIALRGLFIIDPKMVLRQIIVNDLPIGRSVTEVLRLIKALQYYEKNGEVCPVDWNEGDEGIDPNNSGKYFKKHFN